MDHIIKAPGNAQSKEACHTAQMAFSLTAMTLCHMPAKPVPQRIESHWAGPRPWMEEFTYNTKQSMTEVGQTSLIDSSKP